VGDLLRVPERALVNRLGPALLPLLALARGQDAASPPRAPGDARFEEGTELEAEAVQLEPLLFVLRGLLARLAERLAARGLAFGPLALELALEGGGRDARTLGLAAPTLDVRLVLRLVALALEAAPPSAPVLAIFVTTEGATPRGDQLDFFAPAGPAPAALSRTLAELAALCGPERVGAPALADSHRPDAFALAPFVLPPRRTSELAGARDAAHGFSDVRRTAAQDVIRDAESSASAWSGRPAAHAQGHAHHAGAIPTQPPVSDAACSLGLAVRALRPPLAAAVRSARGAPCWVQSALANGEVVRCAGPWRTTGQWWSEARYAFDHYDVSTADGLVVRLRHDLLHERWEIDGVFD
jgi:protein ImuB